MKTIIAIDPGESGGIAIASRNGVRAVPMPATQGDLVELLKSVRDGSKQGECIALVEEQTGCAGIKVSAPAMFKFGRNYGFVLGALQMDGWRIETVRPQTWMKALGLGTRNGMTKSQWKNKLKAKAQQLFPKMKVTLSTADALLLLECGMRRLCKTK